MSDQIQASHILISTTAELSKEDALEKIEQLKLKIVDAEDFSDLAKQHSDCPSASKGGHLGSFGRGAMVPTFDKAVFDLGVGEISEVVETEFGFHLIHRTG